MCVWACVCACHNRVCVCVRACMSECYLVEIFPCYIFIDPQISIVRKLSKAHLTTWWLLCKAADVVYFDQQMGGPHAVRWSKYTTSRLCKVLPLIFFGQIMTKTGLLVYYKCFWSQLDIQLPSSPSSEPAIDDVQIRLQ